MKKEEDLPGNSSAERGVLHPGDEEIEKPENRFQELLTHRH